MDQIAFKTDTSKTNGLDPDDITGTGLEVEGGLDAFIETLQAVYQNTTWYDLQTGAEISNEALQTLDCYPYFVGGVVCHDFGIADDDENTGCVVYMNPLSEVLRIVPQDAYAWDLWDMMW